MDLPTVNRVRNLSSKALVVAAAILMLLAMAPAMAFAHAKPTSSTPADGASVTSGLTQVVINFSEEISVDQSNAVLTSSSGPVAGATSSVDRANRKVMTIQTPALTPGKYTVKWHVVTEDDNGITDGTFGFTVSDAASAAPGTTSSTSTTTTTANPSGGSPDSLPATGAASDSLMPAIFAAAAMLVLAGGVALRRSSSTR